MVIRITWGLILVAIGLLIGGFLTTDSNVLLILSIAFAIAAILIVLAAWARQARESSSYAFDEDLVLEDDDGEPEEGEEALADPGEEFAVGSRRRSRSRPGGSRGGSKPKTKAKAKPKAKAKRKAKAKAKAKPKASATKAKKAPARKSKPKAKPARPKSRPPRRPSSEGS